jgi:GMP synthase (glutamine-hydrolysing)
MIFLYQLSHLFWISKFLGPGLAIRIDGEITDEKIRLAQETDDIFIRSIQEFGIYDEIWQGIIFS